MVVTRDSLMRLKSLGLKGLTHENAKWKLKWTYSPRRKFAFVILKDSLTRLQVKLKGTLSRDLKVKV